MFAKYISEFTIQLDIVPTWEQIQINDDDEEQQQSLAVDVVKNWAMQEMAQLLDASGKILNVKKLSKDFLYVEKQHTSAIGCGVVIPHVKCLQAKSFAMGLIRYAPPFDFKAPDEQQVHLFVPMVAPPYNDRDYERCHKAVENAFENTDIKDRLLNAKKPGEVIRIFDECCR